MQPLRLLQPLLTRPASVATRSTSLRHTQRQQPPPSTFPLMQSRWLSVSRGTRPNRPRRPSLVMRQGVPLYELPRSVIDLDAEDNRHVRPYDEAVDGPPEEDKWADAHASIDALRDRITDLEYEIEQSRKRMLETASKPTAWRILDRDILSAALLGPQKYKEPTEGATAGPETRTAPRIVPNDEASVLAEVLYRNGISPRQAFQQVPLLLHREEKARMQFGIGDWKSLSGVLYGCQSVLEARRILGLAVQTAEGRTGILVDSKRIAHLLGSFIEKAQQEAAKAATATAGNDLVDTVRQVSELLLNLSHALASVADLVEQEDNGAPLWAVGLWASALASEPAAMQRFLRLGVAFGNAEDVSQFMSVYSSNRAEASRREPPAVVLALHTVLLQLQRSPMAFANTRSDLFTMLTGVSRLTDKNSAVASFRIALSAPEFLESLHSVSDMMVPAHPEYGELYILVLAELGGIAALWSMERRRFYDGLARLKMKPIAPDIKVMAVSRYASYMKFLMQPAHYSKRQAVDLGAVSEDLKTIFRYDRAEKEIGGVSTFNAKPGPRKQMRGLPDPGIDMDDAFRHKVMDAYAKTSLNEFVSEIDEILHISQDP